MHLLVRSALPRGQRLEWVGEEGRTGRVWDGMADTGATSQQQEQETIGRAGGRPEDRITKQQTYEGMLACFMYKCEQAWAVAYACLSLFGGRVVPRYRIIDGSLCTYMFECPCTSLPIHSAGGGFPAFELIPRPSRRFLALCCAVLTWLLQVAQQPAVHRTATSTASSRGASSGFLFFLPLCVSAQSRGSSFPV